MSIRARPPLGGGRVLTYREIAARMGISASRVQQLEAKALKKLRKKPAARALLALALERKRFADRRESVVYDGGAA